MIRVVYRWKAKSNEEDLFVKAWIRVTRAIRAQLKGAWGSQLLRNRNNSREFMAIARWESFEDWQVFRQGERIDLEGIEAMHAAGELLSIEVWDEVENLLKEEA
jgi:heme-degrading monooxygenase HmoA